MRHVVLCVILLSLAMLSAPAQGGNLLRNGDFQDDWITHLLETKNHHWNYSSEYQHRRDFNPDNWWMKGSWDWRNADAAPGSRHLVLHGPNAGATQRVNWVMINDERQLTGFPDGGGFPTVVPVRGTVPLTLVRDLTLRVRVIGKQVPADAGRLEVGYAPYGGDWVADPMGLPAKPVAFATAMLPTGTYDTTVEVRLTADAWLKAVQAAADAKEKESQAKDGPQLPAVILVRMTYTGATGEVELRHAELTAAPPTADNLLPHGDFEAVDAAGYLVGWDAPQPYGYFAPRGYYRFNTWHNTGFPLRGHTGTDTLIVRSGARSLHMLVPAGDSVSVTSQPLSLNQRTARLIEVNVWVKTDHLNGLQIDGLNENGQRLDGWITLHKAPVAIGTDEWRLMRQVFRPREPVQELRLQLCARGVNGYTLDDTGLQPQNNVAGTVWWDDVRVFEPETTAEELAERGVRPAARFTGLTRPTLTALNLGEQLLGENRLTATVNTRGRADLRLRLTLTSPSGKTTVSASAPVKAGTDEIGAASLSYTLSEPCPSAYTEYRGALALLDGKTVVASTPVWIGTWVTPLDLEIGATYLRPEQAQFVRMNLGLSAATLRRVQTVSLELVRRGTGQVLRRWSLPATAADFAAQREKIPSSLREDIANLLLTDLDLSGLLPLQPFNDPQRNWVLRARLLDKTGNPLPDFAPVDSAPFCRLAHDPPQPPIQTVAITGNRLYVNGAPWMPWGVVYGFIPVYDGPADPGTGKYRDLRNLPGWTYYDGFTGTPYTRAKNDFNCLRYVAGYSEHTDPKLLNTLEKAWTDDNLYCSTFFIVSNAIWSVEQLIAKAGGAAPLADYLSFARTAPMVVSTTTGVEEAFGQFHAAMPGELAGMGDAAKYLHTNTGKPVMVGHGGGWNRFEFEKVPYFDIYDPETEPWYPAMLHVDLSPLTRGKDQVTWLRPQMYEDVPYERWRYHVFVEMMRGCTGWQIAHGPGDQSTFRGLHAEMERMKPIIYSNDPGPAVAIEPWVEHWSRRLEGNTYVSAAVTYPLRVGTWQWGDTDPRAGRARTGNGTLSAGPEPITFHGIHYLPDPVTLQAGTKLVQWVKLDPAHPPRNLAVLLKTQGRWNRAAGWGGADISGLRADKKRAYEFLTRFYMNSSGFLGWDDKLVDRALEYLPAQAVDQGPLPAAGQWVRLEVSLDNLHADGVLDGIACLHEGGVVAWGRSALVLPDGAVRVLIGNSLTLPAAQLAKTKISVAGLTKGTKVHVLFEDREITAADGYFIDDFRGQDLYQRFGGPAGYGVGPVALHVYDIPGAK